MARFSQPLLPVSDIPDEGSAVVEFFGRRVHVVRGAHGVPAAYMDACMHLGGPLACEGGEFRCGWHGATFDARTGRRTGGPAREGTRLMRLPTVVEDGVLTYVWETERGGAPAQDAA
ncbi:MAG TPA: Rieske 2Fe-2S domain-containing protein [Dehalococcoidia bacterium]|nr:Rieske 2Fe-2S domain-containing protein [Dehalococcoidia bacterium]